MGWRKDLVEKIVAELETGIPELETVRVFHEAVDEGIDKGRILKPPFALVQYVGFTSETLGETAKREIVIAILFGVNRLRGEQAAFRGDDAPSGAVTMDEILEKFDEHFWGLDLGTRFPAIIGDEAYEGTTQASILFSVDLIIQGIFKLD